MKKARREDDVASGATSIGDALRATGLGEARYAKDFELMLGRLRGTEKDEAGVSGVAGSVRGSGAVASPSAAAGVGKLWLDAMKEWARHLDSAVEIRERVASGEDGGPVVELVHHVARPARERREEESRQIGFHFLKEGI
jgi:hypothetical protein